MKTVFFKKVFLFMVLFCTVFSAFAQDEVTMLNGEKREGKVVAVTDASVKFIYKGEILEYEFKKADIHQIAFESGRIEMIHAVDVSRIEPAAAAADSKGKLAVLPFEFISNESSITKDAMAQQLQKDAYHALKENTRALTFQDPLTTNNILARNGLLPDQLTSKTPQELAVLLGVEFVVYGTAAITTKGASTYGNGTAVYSDKATEKKEGTKETTKATGSVYSSNSTTTLTNYDTTIDLNFYNDQGMSIYSQSRKAMGTESDAYHATISYLIKRCPFGTKAKK